MNFLSASSSKFFEKNTDKNRIGGVDTGSNVDGGIGGGASSGVTTSVILRTKQNSNNSNKSSLTLSTTTSGAPSTRFVPFLRRTSDTTTTTSTTDESESDDFGKSTNILARTSSANLKSLRTPAPSSSSNAAAKQTTNTSLHRHSLHQISLMPSLLSVKPHHHHQPAATTITSNTAATASSSSAAALETVEFSSSYSRSSSDSCGSTENPSLKNSNFNCMLQDLDEINQLGAELENDLMSFAQNENLDDFRSRLNLRRKMKSRDCFYLDDDRSNASIDSTTTQAHREILRSADLLRQEPSIYSYHPTGQVASSSSYGKHYNSSQPQPTSTQQLHPSNGGYGQRQNQPSISRSKTETSLRQEEKSNSSQEIPNKNALTKSSPSPRFSRKKSQVLKAATSIPSLLFSNKNNSKSTKTLSYYQEPNKSPMDSKKNSIDDDSFFSTKARRSPLRFLGNLVDDKLFRGRWSSQKRAKSTDEITWALANEEMLMKNQQDNRKKSLGFLSAHPISRNEDRFAKSQTINIRTPQQPSNSGRSFNPEYSPSTGRQTMRNDNDRGIDAATLAEIDAFEALLADHLIN